MRTAADRAYWRGRLEAAVRAALERQRRIGAQSIRAAITLPQPPQPPQPGPLWDPSTWDDIVDDEVRPVAEEAVTHAGTSATQALPSAVGALAAIVGLGDGWVDRIVAAARGLGNRTAERLTVLPPGQQTPENIDAIFDGAAGQAANIGSLAVQAANSIAQDAVGVAAEQGFSLEKTWNTVGDGNVREDHFLAEGQTVPAQEPFEVGDDLLMFPGDPTGSDEQIMGCRCWLTFEGYGQEGDQPDPGAAMGEADVSDLGAE